MDTDSTEIEQPSGPVIHEATRIPGGVCRGAALSEAEAVIRRRAGLDIVVCGDDTIQNRDLAEEVERQVGGPYYHDNPAWFNRRGNRVALGDPP